MSEAGSGAFGRIPLFSDEPRVGRVLLEVEGVSKVLRRGPAIQDLTLDVRAGGARSAGTTARARAPSCGRSWAWSTDDGVIRFDGVELSLRNAQERQAHGVVLGQPGAERRPGAQRRGQHLPRRDRRPAPLPEPSPVVAGARRPSTISGSVTCPSGPLSRRSRSASASSSRSRDFVRDARLLILDEPTATGKPEIERVFQATRDLVRQGRTSSSYRIASTRSSSSVTA